MSSAVTQVVTQFEDLGMSIEEIAQDQELDVIAVKAALLQGSEKYRRMMTPVGKNDDTSAFSATEADLAKNVIIDLMVGAEDENLRGKLARYVRDDAKGRLDPKTAKKLNINVLVFNQVLDKARAAKRNGMAKVISGAAGATNRQLGPHHNHNAPQSSQPVLDLQPA